MIAEAHVLMTMSRHTAMKGTKKAAIAQEARYAAGKRRYPAAAWCLMDPLQTAIAIVTQTAPMNISATR